MHFLSRGLENCRKLCIFIHMLEVDIILEMFPEIYEKLLEKCNAFYLVGSKRTKKKKQMKLRST